MSEEDRAYRRAEIRRNILIAPVVIFVRAPIMIIGMPLLWLATKICEVGEALPGWRHL